MIEAEISPWDIAAMIVLVEEAGGLAAERIARARAERWSLENREGGRTERFASELASYRARPRFYRARRAPAPAHQ